MQAIYNIAEICARKDVKNVILSPGSRCAPLTLAFARHEEISTKTISDERSAAFIAIGISQQTQKTTCLVCTSGSAAYNYAPAIAEAFYQQIPLLILTADRPPEWIDQWDGQTIRQSEIFGKHVKRSYSLPIDDGHEDTRWYIERTISEAINCTQDKPWGPVHINIPLREPLYPSSSIQFSKNLKVIQKPEKFYDLPDSVWNELFFELFAYKRVIFLAGQSNPGSSFKELIDRLIRQFPIVFVSDVISNFHDLDQIIKNHDIILSGKEIPAGLYPDLLITFGKSVISKNLKLFLRESKPLVHWHIQETGHVPDTFQALKKIIPIEPQYFFEQLEVEFKYANLSMGYHQLWKDKEAEARRFKNSFFSTVQIPFNEFFAIQRVLKQLPEDSVLHLSNSMPVRYGNYVGLEEKKHIEVFSNRGTSGIDGVMSTAVGAAIITLKIVTVIIGDMAFFYDRNAFWNNYLPSNLRIVILNNHGGGIFRMIDGPNKQPELEQFFETEQPLNDSNLAKEFNIEYIKVESFNELNAVLPHFYQDSGKSKILEIETISHINKEIFYQFKNQIIQHGK